MTVANRASGPNWRQFLGKGSRLAGALAGLLIIVLWTYLFGHPLLEGSIAGSDSGYHLSIVHWIDRWFPQLPNWYPLQATGSSSVQQYPYAAHIFVVLLSRVTGLSLVHAFRITQFASVAATACGVYWLTWWKFRSQTAGLLAGLFYPLSAASWHWLVAIGLFAQSASLVFFAPAFVLFDIYRAGAIDKPDRGGRRRRFVALAGAAIGFCLMVVTHPTTAIVFALTAGVYSLLAPLSQRGLHRLSSAARGLVRTGIPLGLGVGFAAFWLRPYFRVDSLATRDGVTSDYALHQIPYIDVFSVLGAREAAPEHPMWAVTFASPVLILAAFGVVFSLKDRGPPIVLFAISILSVLMSALPGILPEVVALVQELWVHTNTRALIPAMVFLPAVAGYGAVRFAQLVVDLMSAQMRRFFSAGKETISREGVWGALRSGSIALLGVGIASGAFVFLRHSPPGYGDYPGYGATLRDEWWPFEFDGFALAIGHWPEFARSNNDYPNGGEIAHELASRLDLDSGDRLELSPRLGAVLQTLPLYSESSTVGIYFYEGTFIRAMKGYQTSAYWNPGYGSAHEVDEFAKWFGINFIVMDPNRDSSTVFNSDDWPTVRLPDDGYLRSIEVRQFASATGPASIRTVPKILVIGGETGAPYHQIFKLFNGGAVPYSQATLIEGSGRVDDYSLEELSSFDMLLLHGYSYSNRESAWELVDGYVRDGGSLFIDTGWQYRVPDWETEFTAGFFPFESLDWYAGDSQVQLSLATDSGRLNTGLSNFAPMIWNDEPWGISSSDRELRERMTPVLVAGERPVVTIGRYGQGRVVWSGMNLVGHIRTYPNSDEAALLGNLIQWALPNAGGSWNGQITVHRDHPDHITIDVVGHLPDSADLLWREAFAPGWMASIDSDSQSESRPIYRAGPGMMLIDLPSSAGDQLRVQLDYDLGAAGWTGDALSVLSIGLLIAYPAVSRRLRERGAASQLPKPFLGDGANMEWAEQKRAELSSDQRQEGRAPVGLTFDQDAEGSLGRSTQTDSDREVIGEPSSSSRPLELGSELADNDHGLLESWLGADGHAESEWAKRLLGKRDSVE